MKWLIMVLLAVTFGLAGCGGDKDSGNNRNVSTQQHAYTPGETVDAEDYNGPAQKVIAHDYEPDVRGTRTKNTSNCRKAANRNKPSCKESYIKDDADYYLVLADGTRVDGDQAMQVQYFVGSIYPAGA